MPFARTALGMVSDPSDVVDEELEESSEPDVFIVGTWVGSC